MKKKVLIIFALFALLMLAVFAAYVTVSNKKKEFSYEGWIDCMPPLSDNEAKLCKEAEEANYPYITY